MAYYPYAVEKGAIYKLVSPDGIIAVFNDPTDPNYVGMVSDISGLDSAEVRESAEDLVESDGGTHGNFYFGRRPIAITARVFGHTSIREREIRIDRAKRASMAMRGDATLSWRPTWGGTNEVTNPRAVNNTAGWSTASSLVAGGTLSRVTGISPSVGSTGFQIVTSGSGNANQGASTPINVTAGKVYTAHVRARRTAGAGAAEFAVFGSGTSGTTGITSINSTTWETYTFTFVPTISGTVNLGVRQNNSNLVPSTFQFSQVMATSAKTDIYFDGDVGGTGWEGTAHGSRSVNFLEMFTYVRRQQRFIEAGDWIKEIQMQLVSEYAPIFSSKTYEFTAPSDQTVSISHYGSYDSYPTIEISGMSTNPKIVNMGNGEIFGVNGLTVASGEILQIDTLNHSARFLSTNTSANRYIDYASYWPKLKGNGIQSDYRLQGGGSVKFIWRDVWI